MWGDSVDAGDMGDASLFFFMVWNRGDTGDMGDACLSLGSMVWCVVMRGVRVPPIASRV